MMTTDTKDLIARARLGFGTSAGMPTAMLAYQKLCDALADELERLTQPVGVGPIGFHSAESGNTVWYHGIPPGGFYSAETVARLQAERDIERSGCDDMQRIAEKRTDECNALQEQVKTLQRLVRNSTEFRLGVPEFEALAGTENKEPK